MANKPPRLECANTPAGEGQSAASIAEAEISSELGELTSLAGGVTVGVSRSYPQVNGPNPSKLPAQKSTLAAELHGECAPCRQAQVVAIEYIKSLSRTNSERRQ
jgi:hypothetical protein